MLMTSLCYKSLGPVAISIAQQLATKNVVLEPMARRFISTGVNGRHNSVLFSGISNKFDESIQFEDDSNALDDRDTELSSFDQSSEENIGVQKQPQDQNKFDGNRFDEEHGINIFDEEFERRKNNSNDVGQEQQTQLRRRATGINRVELLGNVASVPTERTAQNGRQYSTFAMFTNTDIVKANGELLAQSEFHNVIAYGPLARYVLENLQKGDRVFIQGRLHYWGGLQMEDGSRTPRSASISAEWVLPVRTTWTFGKQQ